MTHRRFDVASQGNWYCKDAYKYLPAREHRLFILHLANTKNYGILLLNAIGGVANDRHITKLVKDKMLKRSKYYKSNTCSNCPPELTYEAVSITDKGRKYLERYTK
jgi:hypothetical protein